MSRKISKLTLHQHVEVLNSSEDRKLRPYDLVNSLSTKDGYDITYEGNGDYLVKNCHGEMIVHSSNVKSAYLIPTPTTAPIPTPIPTPTSTPTSKK